ncbi:ABC transporter substrate-binding protein [Chloroflexota bacterium]
MKNRLLGILFCCLVPVILISFVAACAVPADREEPLPVEITDHLGRTVRLKKVPERIISLAPSNTEILFALGLEDNLVGVTEFCDYPEAAKEKPQVGGFSNVDMERVVAMQPDLILAADIHKDEVIPALEKVGLPVVCLTPTNLEEVLASIRLIGEITGKNDEASRLVTDMDNRIKAVTDKTSTLPEAQRPRVFYIIWHEPLMTVGPDTRIHELLEMTGGINIAREMTDGYPTINLEAVIEANPQIIIVGSGMGEGADLPFQFASSELRLKDVDARINDRIYEINTDLVGRPGPRIVDALEQLAEFQHPELFKEK